MRKFQLVSRLLTWDPKYFYIEQRFVSGGQLCAVALVKGLFLHRHARVETQTIVAALDSTLTAPAMPEVVRHWNDLGTLKRQHLN